MSESATPTTRRRETTRQRLLDAAAQVFAEVGLDAASVEAVCERAGFTRGAFYSNFDSQNELFLELSARVARERVDAVTARVAALEEEGAFDVVPGAAVQLVQQVMDVSSDDRLGVLLMAEIRISRPPTSRRRPRCS
jgi:AcrR family transcriptional regulator